MDIDEKDNQLKDRAIKCRSGCGACCIALSISSPLPGLPKGKPAGIACPHLSSSFSCQLYNRTERPQVCDNLKPMQEMCGSDRDQALAYLSNLELITEPDATVGVC